MRQGAGVSIRAPVQSLVARGAEGEQVRVPLPAQTVIRQVVGLRRPPLAAPLARAAGEHESAPPPLRPLGGRHVGVVERRSSVRPPAAEDVGDGPGGAPARCRSRRSDHARASRYAILPRARAMVRRRRSQTSWRRAPSSQATTPAPPSTARCCQVICGHPLHPRDGDALALRVPAQQGLGLSQRELRRGGLPYGGVPHRGPALPARPGAPCPPRTMASACSSFGVAAQTTFSARSPSTARRCSATTIGTAGPWVA